jgi:hypothetical protein
MNGHTVNNKVLSWVLTLSMLTAGTALQHDALRASLGPALQRVAQLQRQSCNAVRYTIWLYRLYKVNSLRSEARGSCHPGA